MQILVTQVTVNARGQTKREQRRVSGAVFRIGRGSQCEIHLPDSRVALLHAQLTVTGINAKIETGSGQLRVNGREVNGAELVVGDSMEIGPYQIEVESPPEGLQLAISVRHAAAFGKDPGMLRRFRTRGPRLSVRRLSYLAFVAVVTLFLVLPAVSDYWSGMKSPASDSRLSTIAEVGHTLSAAFVQTWSPGPLSRSHQVFGDKCDACHAQPFIQVRDQECIVCHKTIREHVPRLTKSGVHDVALNEVRCAECHRDHKDAPLATRAQAECVSCHGGAGNSSGEATRVTDFGKDHPQFVLSLPDPARPGKPLRVRQGEASKGKLLEKSNLKFNHKLHLDPGGVRDPQGARDSKGMYDAKGRRTVLICASCHEPERDGRLMAPVSMERHCQSCHSLAFEPSVTARQAPHGSEEAIATMLREFYARLVLGDLPSGVLAPKNLPRMRPGTALSVEDRALALRIADRKAQQVLNDLFDHRQVCSTCHHVSRRSDAVGWTVAPVAVAQTWMPGAQFTHAKHETSSCVTCHDVAKSSAAEDVTMPDIAKCRECHVGSSPVHNRVTSDCVICHKFHAGAGYWNVDMQMPLLKRVAK